MIPDRENVIYGVNVTISFLQTIPGDVSIRLIEYQRDAIAMLKEQDAKPPAIMQDIEGIWSTCSMCGHKLRPILAMEMDTYFPKFCSECGQAVKWE